MLNTDSLKLALESKTKSALNKQIWIIGIINIILLVIVVIFFINQRQDFDQKTEQCISNYKNTFKESVIKYNDSVNKCVEYIEIKN